MNTVAAYTVTAGQSIKFAGDRTTYVVLAVDASGSEVTMTLRPPYNGKNTTITCAKNHFAPVVIVK